MNKQTLVNKLADKLHITRCASKIYLNAFEEVLTESLQADDPIMLQGFGSFSLWRQSGRPARNPKTGVPCMIAPRNSVKFKPGKGLLDKLNNR